MRRGRPYRYLTNCVACGNGRAINRMTAAARPVTWGTFIQNVPWEEVQEVFPSYSYRGEKFNPMTGELTAPFHIKDDYAVSFWHSHFQGRECFYIVHSAIEYIWTR